MFKSKSGQRIPALTEDQMREVDRIAMEDFGLGIFQMMENAGRNLALNVMDMIGSHVGEVTILAGSGGNGGGGICCARHLYNRGFNVHLILDRDPNELRGSALAQFRILEKAGLGVAKPDDTEQLIREADIVVDALIGYSLRGAPKGRTAELIYLANQNAARILSLDLPSGMNATTGEAPGIVIRPERTLTLALPKTGLHQLDGELYLADIGIPPEVYHPLDIHFMPFFGEQYWIPLVITN
jgi:NAD(P)H-hydrate epimerase